MDPDELLNQARRLATSVGIGPVDADLRRAVSAAYYAVFHMLVGAAAVQAAPSGVLALQAIIRRAISHAQVVKACEMFSRPWERMPDALRHALGNPPSTDLVAIARALPELQEARHRADYDWSAWFIETEVLDFLALAGETKALWLSVQHTPEAAVFLTAVLLGDKFGRRG